MFISFWNDSLNCHLIQFQHVPTKEVQHALAQLILLNGFQTDPNKPGTEKVVGCAVQPSWLFTKPTALKADDVCSQSTLVGPGRFFLVKGWNRCVRTGGALCLLHDPGAVAGLADAET